MATGLIELQLELQEQLGEFVGLSSKEIAYKMGLNPEFLTTKSAVVTLANRMLMQIGFDKESVDRSLSPLQLVIKTVRLEINGKPKESMSLETIKFMDFIEESWEDSFLNLKFSNTVFLFVVFQYQKISGNSPSLIFKGINFWKMPSEDLNNSVKKMWEDTKDIVTRGVILKEVFHGNKIIIKNNLPGMSDNPILHIRPKAKDGNDKVELPCGNFITKQAYWINSKYIAKILSDLPILINKSEKISFTQSKYAYPLRADLKNALIKPAYTVDEFIEIVSHKNPGYSQIHINSESLAPLNYKIDSRFIVSEKFNSIDEYIEEIIFKTRYFQVPETPIFQTSYVQRKIENFENSFELIEVEPKIYLSTRGLTNNLLDRNAFRNYIEDVADFMGYNKFFTLKSLKSSGFSHELEEFGFDEMFYESLLKRPGRIKSIKLLNKPIFIRTKSKVVMNDFITYMLKNEKSLSLNDFIERTSSELKIDIDYGYAIQLMEKSSYFFSNELKKLFINMETYYDEIYG